MPIPSSPRPTSGGAREYGVAGFFVVLSLLLTQLPPSAQQNISTALTRSVLSPFVWTQRLVNNARFRSETVARVTAERDTLTARMAEFGALVNENRRLRQLLGLSNRIGQRYVPASVIRSATPGSRSHFILDVGTQDGVEVGSFVLTPEGLVGVVRQAWPDQSIGMDWSHPEFRVSAMTENGEGYGFVTAERGRFVEEDRLLLDGLDYYDELEPGTPVVTSGLGGRYPKGIAIGTVQELAEEETGWRRSYWLVPASQLGEVTHVLVHIGEGPVVPDSIVDLSSIWPADSILDRRYGPEIERQREAARADSLAWLQERFEFLLDSLGLELPPPDTTSAPAPGDTIADTIGSGAGPGGRP